MKDTDRMKMDMLPEPDAQQQDKTLKTASARRRMMAALAAAFFCGSFFTLGVGGAYLRWQQQSHAAITEKLEEIENLIDQYYLYDVDEEAAANGIATGYADALDVYSCYRDKEAYEEFQAHNDGDLCGIGITVAQYGSDALNVLYLLDDSPAAGILQPSDAIVGVEGESVESLGYTGAVAKIQGEAGTSVQLTIRRNDELMDVSVERADVVNSGIYFQQFDQIGYLRISAFNNATPAAFKEAIEELMQQGVSGLIFDLRGNGGGYMSDLQAISAHLLKNAEGNSPVVARAVFRDGSETLYRADGNDYSAYFTDESRITVLADENTASASECLIGALIDYGTIGYEDIYLRHDAETGVCRTYGKGVMQSTFTTISGDAFRLTVAEIFWPNGNSIHEKGVTPSYPQAGAHAVTAPMLPDGTDAFLAQVLAALA